MSPEKLQLYSILLSDFEMGLILLNLLSLKEIARGYYKMKQRQMGEDNGYDKL